MTPRSMDKTASRVSDADTTERRLNLWFFRDLSDDQRTALLRLCFYPDKEFKTHSSQQIALDRILRSLSSDSVSDGSKGVRVKPLEWEDDGIGLRAKGYRIERGNENIYVRSSEATGLFATIEFASSIEEAKAAAQADYEQRILSAIALDSGTGGQQPVAWRFWQPTPDGTGYWVLMDYAEGMHGKKTGHIAIEPLYSAPTEPKAGVVEKASIHELEQSVSALEEERQNLIATKREQISRLVARAESAEADLARAREALEGIDRLVANNIHDNGADINRMLVDGTWHTGPVVDASFRIIKGLGQIARAALPNTTGEAE